MLFAAAFFTGCEAPKAQSDAVAETLSDFDLNNYTYIAAEEADTHAGDIILVNAAHPYDFGQTSELASVYDNKTGSYKVKDTLVSLQKHILEPFNEMMDAFNAATSIDDVNVVSGYRDYDSQQQLYENKVAVDGAEEASLWVAAPGNSEHHTGFAIDLSIYRSDGTSYEFDGSGKYAWIIKNANKYGFVVRYEKAKTAITGTGYEPWHLRYVGLPHSSLMAKLGYCLEEYIDYLKDFEFGNKHLLVKTGGKTYEIYTVPFSSAGIPVPVSGSYTVSGDNDGGFIVTIGR